MILFLVQGLVQVDSNGNRLNIMTLLFQYRLLNSNTGINSTLTLVLPLFNGQKELLMFSLHTYWDRKEMLLVFSDLRCLLQNLHPLCGCLSQASYACFNFCCGEKPGSKTCHWQQSFSVYVAPPIVCFVSVDCTTYITTLCISCSEYNSNDIDMNSSHHSASSHILHDRYAHALDSPRSYFFHTSQYSLMHSTRKCSCFLLSLLLGLSNIKSGNKCM